MIILALVCLTLPLAFILASGPVKRIFKKPSFDIDYVFEEFVCNDLFPPNKFNIEPHAANVASNVDLQLISIFRFHKIESSFEFYVVVAPFIKGKLSGKFYWYDPQQFDTIKRSIPKAYLAVGLGSDALNPDFLYLIAFNKLKSHCLSNADLNGHRVLDYSNISETLEVLK